jgi:hypothetical protein
VNKEAEKVSEYKDLLIEIQSALLLVQLEACRRRFEHV